MQPVQQVVMTLGDETTSQEQPQVQPPTEHQPDQPVATAYTTTTRQTLQTLEMAPHASDAENKATWGQNAERECFATIARPTTMTQKHAESNTTTSQALPTAK